MDCDPIKCKQDESAHWQDHPPGHNNKHSPVLPGATGWASGNEEVDSKIIGKLMPHKC